MNRYYEVVQIATKETLQTVLVSSKTEGHHFICSTTSHFEFLSQPVSTKVNSFNCNQAPRMRSPRFLKRKVFLTGLANFQDFPVGIKKCRRKSSRKQLESSVRCAWTFQENTILIPTRALPSIQTAVVLEKPANNEKDMQDVFLSLLGKHETGSTSDACGEKRIPEIPIISLEKSAHHLFQGTRVCLCSPDIVGVFGVSACCLICRNLFIERQAFLNARYASAISKSHV